MKYFIFLFSCVILTACTSAPLTVNHYLLHTPTTAIISEPNNQKNLVVFSSVTIADYLRQASLIIQIDEHELHYSRQDLWAEGLQSSFYKALKHDLNLSTDNQYAQSHQNSENELILKVNLEHFLITNHANVVSSGTYSIEDINSQWLEKSFYFTMPLEMDGYPHAVSQLRMTINALAQQVNQDIQNLPDSHN